MTDQRRIVEVTDAAAFALVPPCADPRFDHRTCDYWEDADRGSKRSRPGWLEPSRPRSEPGPKPGLHDNPFGPGDLDVPDANPFAGAARASIPDAFADDDLFAVPF